MSGPRIQVSTSSVDHVADQIDDVGTELQHVAKRTRAQETHASHRSGLGPGDAFGMQIAESSHLGEQCNDLINMLAAYGDLLADTFKHAARQMHTMSDNYVRTDDSMAGK